MTDTTRPNLNLEIKEEMEATVETEERLFSDNPDDRGYILNTDNGEREWHLKGAEVEGDDFEMGDRIRITLKDGHTWEFWPKGTPRPSTSTSSDEPERFFYVEKIGSQENE